MIDFQQNQKHIIYDSLLFYKKNNKNLHVEEHMICEELIEKIYFNIKDSYIEPAYRIHKIRHGGDLDAL